MTTELLRTPLHDWHVSHGGRMVDFAGWSMPVQYKSIADEHNATRNAVGVFDISHMGRLEFMGSNVHAQLDRIVTRRVTDMEQYQVRYALVCDEKGGILDDVLIYFRSASFHEEARCDIFTVVVNASNRAKIVAWLRTHCDNPRCFHDDTLNTAMIAVQGPKAVEVLQPFFQYPHESSLDLRSIKYYHSAFGFFSGELGMPISRTGYTGEDGFELICTSDVAPAIWDRIVSEAQKIGGMACGLGARDTLRLEAAMPLYGHELSEAINPIQAGLNFAVNLGGREFIGSKALEKFAADKSQPVRIGIQLDSKRVPREGCPVLKDGAIV
ncbi:MAG TPA: glycine cleavage system aminomethyltransferase GcvT, partial [Lacipirellulaceae bacterium]|nr:glycine cleavage system aminomethyltransferase GcvT [Lacipirellulaceae bacterium]